MTSSLEGKKNKDQYRQEGEKITKEKKICCLKFHEEETKETEGGIGLKRKKETKVGEKERKPRKRGKERMKTN